MDGHRPQRDHGDAEWRVCLECGNRYQAADHGYLVSWCSTTCEDRSLRRQRDDIEDTWMRARWFMQ